MSLPAQLLVALLAGAALGVVFFWGLWLTVRDLERSAHAGLRLLTSLVLRLALAAGGLYLLVTLGGWPHLLAGAVGFTGARAAAIRRARRSAPRMGPSPDAPPPTGEQAKP